MVQIQGWRPIFACELPLLPVRTLGGKSSPVFCCRMGIEHMYDREVGAAGNIKELAAALACLAVAPVAGDIEELLALRDRLDAKISEVLRAFDAERCWAEDGSLSLTAWLAAHGRRSRKEAHREALTAKRLSQLPTTATAWAEGVLSSSQVGAVVANVPAEHAGLYAAHEDELTPVLAALSVRDTAAAMRSWRLHAEATTDGAEPASRPSEFYLSETLEGRRELSGHLSAEDDAVVEAAIAAAGRDYDPAELPLPSAAERRAAALVDLCRWFLDNSTSTSSGSRTRPHVSVVVGLDRARQRWPGPTGQWDAGAGSDHRAALVRLGAAPHRDGGALYGARLRLFGEDHKPGAMGGACSARPPLPPPRV